MGYKSARDFERRMQLRLDAKKRDGDKTVNLEATSELLNKSWVARSVMALAYIAGRMQGGIDYNIDYYMIPIQLIVILAVLSTVFTTVQGGVLLIALAVFLMLLLPPTIGTVYFARPFYEANIPLAAVIRLYPKKLLSIQKITLLALTLSFAGGIMHHASLISDSRILKFTGAVNAKGSLVMTLSSGFVIHSSELGYKFVPLTRMQIEVAE